MMADTQEEFNQDIFDSMLSGTFEEEDVVEDTEEVEDTTVEDDDELLEEVGDEDDEYQEDTDQEEESEDEEEQLDDLDDGEDDEDSEVSEDDEEEDSLVEDDDLDESESDEVEDTDGADDASEEDAEQDLSEEEDTTETEEQIDDEAPATDSIDYKAFYDSVVNAEFVVNGRKVKGFSDPQKLIQAQQLAGGYSDKMAGFKKYRPYMAPLKERGMLEDPAKFDLAMNLVDGDVEAIKAHLKTLDIDPIELDMESVEYAPTPTTASAAQITLEDTLERAKLSGVEEKVRDVVGNQWDESSFTEFLENPSVRNDLLTHLETGVYETVQDRIAQLGMADFDGRFSNMSSIEKYRAAVASLQSEQQATTTVDTAAQEAAEASKRAKAKADKVKAEKARILNKRKAEEYKAKAAKQETARSKRRKAAAAASVKKPKSKAKPAFDPLEVSGSEMDELMEALMSGEIR